MFSNHFFSGRSFVSLISSSKLFSGVVTFELLEQELFSVLETDSWLDTLGCLSAYAFVICLLAITLFIPLVFSVLTIVFALS